MVIHQLIEQPPIIQAIIRGDYDELKEIVDKNSDEVNYKDSEKRTALHAAAFKVDISMIELLLNHGAKVNVKDSKWVTPLHWACSSRDQDVVQLLLKHKADPLAKDKQYQSPFHVAAANNSSAEIIELLLVALQENIVQKNNKSSEENIQNDQNSSVCLVKDNSQFNLLDSNVPTESNLVLNNCNNDNFKPKFKYMTLTTPKDNFSPSVLYSLNMADRGGRTLLHHAAFDGSLEIAEYLLSKGCLVNVVDKRDCTPLHWASFSGNEEMVRLLLDYNADPNVQDKDKYTPLHIACMTGNLSVVSELLAHPKTDVNAKNVWGNTPLLVACLHNDCDELVVELLASGAEINMQNHRGDSSLHITAQHGRFTRSELLIDKGAIIDLQDNNNCTALHIAALYGHDLLANTLLMHGADVNLKGFAGRTPLHMSCISGYVECCRKFLQHHVDMDCQDNTGKTPLHCASYSGAVKCLDLLVSSGANFRIPDNINRTPLHYAAAMGRYSCLIALVSVGSDVNKRDKDGCTALHLAAAYDMEGRCLEYLLHHKAEPYLEDYEGYTPIHYAIASKKGNETGLGYLLNSIGGKASVLSNDFKSKFSPLHLAAYYGHGDILRLLLPLFSNVNLTANGARVTALHLASLKGHPQCVQLLLRCGALVNVLNIQLCTPLHCAAAKGHVDCLSLLLNNTEDHSVVNNVDSKKRTALMLSVANKHNECVLRLLQNGADTNIEDENQHTPLFRAVVMGNHEIVRLLLNNKANLYHRNHCGKTVFHMACMLGQLHCLMELIANCFNEEPIRILDNNQFSVHHWAAYNGHAHCLEYLLKCNICKTLEGNIFSPLHCSSNISCVNCLIYYFGNNACHLRDHCNRTPLHIAALYNRTNCIEALISSDADIERRDSNGRTPLLCAAYNGNVQSIEVLLKFKANVFAQDDYGNTVLHICCTRKHSHAACFFLDKCKILQIDLKVLVNITNNQLKIPLHIAAHNGLVSITKQLIKAESDILAVDQNGMTPALNCAASVNVAQCLNLILANYPVINSNIHRNLIVEVDDTIPSIACFNSKKDIKDKYEIKQNPLVIQTNSNQTFQDEQNVLILFSSNNNINHNDKCRSEKLNQIYINSKTQFNNLFISRLFKRSTIGCQDFINRYKRNLNIRDVRLIQNSISNEVWKCEFNLYKLNRKLSMTNIFACNRNALHRFELICKNNNNYLVRKPVELNVDDMFTKFFNSYYNFSLINNNKINNFCKRSISDELIQEVTITKAKKPLENIIHDFFRTKSTYNGFLTNCLHSFINSKNCKRCHSNILSNSNTDNNNKKNNENKEVICKKNIQNTKKDKNKVTINSKTFHFCGRLPSYIIDPELNVYSRNSRKKLRAEESYIRYITEKPTYYCSPFRTIHKKNINHGGELKQVKNLQSNDENKLTKENIIIENIKQNLNFTEELYINKNLNILINYEKIKDLEINLNQDVKTCEHNLNNESCELNRSITAKKNKLKTKKSEAYFKNSCILL